MRPFDEVVDRERMREFVDGLRSLLLPNFDTFATTVEVLAYIIQISDKVWPVKSYLRMVQEVQRASSGFDARARHHAVCTEDVFVAACAYIGAEIAKQGSIYYLSGLAADFKETKKNRSPVELSREDQLKMLAGTLARPDNVRGDVEQSQIESGENHLKRRYDLAERAKKVAAYINENPTATKATLRREFKITATDYERIASLIQQFNMATPLHKRRRDPLRYQVPHNLGQRIERMAKDANMAPEKMLVQLVTNMLDIIDRRNSTSSVASLAAERDI